MQKQIDESKLSDKIKLLGFRRDIASLLGQWDIYVQPSLWEGLCMTVVEAMACGLPVIASNVGGVPESVIESKNGFLITPGDKNLLAEKILELVEKPDLRIQMGRQGRLLAEKKYSLKRMCESIERIMDDFIKSRLHTEWNVDSREWLPCISNKDRQETKIDVLSYKHLIFQKDNHIENILSPSQEKELIEK